MRTTLIITSFLAFFTMAAEPNAAQRQAEVKELPYGTLTLSNGNLFLEAKRDSVSTFSAESLPAPAAMLAEYFPSADASSILHTPPSSESLSEVSPQYTWYLSNPLFTKTSCWGPPAPFAKVHALAMDLSRQMDNWCCQSARKDKWGCDCVSVEDGVGVAICGLGEICTPCSKIGQAVMITLGQCQNNGGVAGTTVLVSGDGYLNLEVRSVRAGGVHWNKQC
ncbi:hypothetical protein FPQ18DRAFT_414020 [Pyronema domesticum]|uniref:Uncharacterized protein n=1 Tax=Pyronema omphalodes (strain CBS 100304) TaxID=1076935 RepID=U4L9F9_PYROM|nr:hypothetical protein FPQ18DRAFT_414020 [Pyronema domesticum]CCX15733.1 Protein of unknown function [Pyronema omphalodes CBS 100304]